VTEDRTLLSQKGSPLCKTKDGENQERRGVSWIRSPIFQGIHPCEKETTLISKYFLLHVEKRGGGKRRFFIFQPRGIRIHKNCGTLTEALVRWEIRVRGGENQPFEKVSMLCKRVQPQEKQKGNRFRHDWGGGGKGGGGGHS